MISSFTGKPILHIVGVIALCIVFTLLIVYFLNPTHHTPIINGISLLLLILSLIIYIIAGLVNKAVEITIKESEISVRKFLGLAKKRTYLFGDLAGYKTETFSYRQDHYERLCIYRGAKIVMQASNYFHEDYPLIKDEISQKLKYFGETAD